MRLFRVRPFQEGRFLPCLAYSQALSRSTRSLAVYCGGVTPFQIVLQSMLGKRLSHQLWIPLCNVYKRFVYLFVLGAFWIGLDLAPTFLSLQASLSPVFVFADHTPGIFDYPCKKVKENL